MKMYVVCQETEYISVFSETKHTSSFSGLMNCPCWCFVCIENINLVLLKVEFFGVAFYLVLIFLWTYKLNVMCL
jgi:hypothetical protein